MILQRRKDLLGLPGANVRSKSAASRLYLEVLAHLEKAPHQLITTHELADYLGVNEADLYERPKKVPSNSQ